MPNADKHINALVFEIRGKEIDEIVDNFSLTEFRFQSVPRKGELVKLRKGLAPAKLYFVETVVHEGLEPNAPRAAGEPEVVLYVSFWRNLPD